jgi:hypothetical protein
VVAQIYAPEVLARVTREGLVYRPFEDVIVLIYENKLVVLLIRRAKFYIGRLCIEYKYYRVSGEYHFRKLAHLLSLGIHAEIQDSAEIMQLYVPRSRESFVGYIGYKKVLVYLWVPTKVFLVVPRSSILHDKEKLS